MFDKNIKIKCIFNSSISIYCYKILIYNSKNEKIVDSYTDKMGVFNFKCPCFGIYKIIIIPDYRLVPAKKCITILVNQKTTDKLSFIFTSRVNYFHPITIKMTDQNYKGLPIMKGKIILWPHT